MLSDYENVLAGREQLGGEASGFQELDRMTGGLRPGMLFVIAARPGMGRTSLLLNIASHVCIDHEKPTLVFSGKVGAFEVVRRIVVSRSRYAMNRLLHHNICPNKYELIRLQKAAADITRSKLYVEDSGGISIEALRETAIRYKEAEQIRLIAIDDLHLVKCESPRAHLSRKRELAELAAGLKRLARDLKIPVLVTASLKSQPCQRSGCGQGVPELSDLWDSGAIEENADVIGLLHRPGYEADDAEERVAEAGKAVLILAKNCGGDTGWIPLIFIDELMSFDPAPDADGFSGGPDLPSEEMQAWSDYYMEQREEEIL